VSVGISNFLGGDYWAGSGEGCLGGGDCNYGLWFFFPPPPPPSPLPPACLGRSGDFLGGGVRGPPCRGFLTSSGVVCCGDRRVAGL